MKSFKIIIFLALLPVTVIAVYFFYWNDNQPAKNVITEGGFSSAPPSALLISKEIVENSKQKLVLSKSRFTEKKSIRNNKKTNVQNAIKYLLFSPPQPWPENLKFPLILHLNDYNTIAYSAEYLSQEQMTYSFPAFSVIPETDVLYKDLDIEKRVKKINQPLNYSVNESNSAKSAVDFKSFRNHSRKILPSLMSLIEDMKENYPIDERRIYLVGCGFGAATLFHLIEKHPNYFASMVALSGTWQAENYNKFKSTPILTLNGKINAMFLNISGETFAANVKKIGGKAIYKGFESMPHTCSHKDFYASNVWKWMFAQKR